LDKDQNNIRKYVQIQLKTKQCKVAFVCSEDV